jgi:hypothetical protein
VEKEYKLRDEAGDVLHYIDFHQLQIENKQYVRRIDDRERELSHAKNLTGKCVAQLNYVKSELNKGQAELKSFERNCNEKRKFIEDLVVEAKNIQTYVKQCKASSKEIKRVLSRGGEMPDPTEFILQRKAHYLVSSELKTWEKRVALSGMALKNSQSAKKAARRERSALADRTNKPRQSVTR